MPVERKPLFRPDVLRPKLRAFDVPPPVLGRRPLVRQWADLLASPAADQRKEQELLADFLNDLFVQVLGYARPADKPQRHTISREQHVETFGKFADAVGKHFHELGAFDFRAATDVAEVAVVRSSLELRMPLWHHGL